MKTRILLSILTTACLWFQTSTAQIVVARRPVVYRPRPVLVVKPARVLLPARRVVIVKPAPIVRAVPVRPRRKVIIYR
ncbi:hypothetical protein EOD41_16575 [Mucilaginibacter limnophilus]|uniref:Uncharacterized protein n=1 Tax=Mucilaginibacter limnophilus TaxID=1932778 RepID=A0A3S2XZ38_9SPHI|nr:hypothetical protein [Mucilaginibacter limnophilus]RVT98407.1 hypothetical protein EOD41_16575 [Mucilaginibacter limnophilus]